MVLGCFSGFGLSPLVPVKGNVNGYCYSIQGHFGQLYAPNIVARVGERPSCSSIDEFDVEELNSFLHRALTLTPLRGLLAQHQCLTLQMLF